VPARSGILFAMAARMTRRLHARLTRCHALLPAGRRRAGRVLGGPAGALGALCCATLWTAGAALAQGLPAAAQAQAQAPQTVVITGTAPGQGLFDLPISADTLDAAAIQQDQPRIDLSESLVRVPGLVAQNRQNYAQDLQVSSRGFGARSAFGVRGLRFFVDGVPATLPDGQGQISHVDLGSAGRIEVLRGPFSALYGNAAGGVVAVTTEEAEGAQLGADVEAGGFGLRREGVKAMGAADGGALHYTLSAGHFTTDGPRPHSGAVRSNQNARLRLALDRASQLTLVLNQVQLQADDPLGLTREAFEADPRQTDAAALRFDTRKTVDQSQFGAVFERRWGAADRLRVLLYAGTRSTLQFQSIPPAAQQAPTSAGGVIDLQRSYDGTDLRWTHEGARGAQRWRWSAGLAADVLHEHRRGYENFVGDTLGARGALRRDERNRAGNVDPYAQLEWEPGAHWLLLAGVRASRVHVRSDDGYVRPGNADDSGAVSYRHTSPVLGLTWRPSQAWRLHASYGQGFETPTLTELAYRSTDGSLPGPNFGLRPAVSNHLEVGAKARLADRLRLQLTAFDVRTRDELAVALSSGGRTVYRNAGRTERSGIEAELDGRWRNGLGALLSVATLRAVYRDGFCNGACDTGAVAAGNHLPGAPLNTVYAELSWRAGAGFESALEWREVGRVTVDDANSDAAAAHALLNWRAGWRRRIGAWTLGAFARIDNLADRRYAGSVIVGEGRGRFFEPGLPRRWVVGASAAWGW
jgi:iron complex outermembrane receptor protein